MGPKPSGGRARDMTDGIGLCCQGLFKKKKREIGQWSRDSHLTRVSGDETDIWHGALNKCEGLSHMHWRWGAEGLKHTW